MMRQYPYLVVIETIAIAAVGGWLFSVLNLPGGLITGAMFAVAIAGLLGRPVDLPGPIGHLVLIVLGMSLGSIVSPEILGQIGHYPITITLLAVATCVTTGVCCLYLRTFHRWDRTSAFLAASPGALSQIVMLATERNADVAGIAVVQMFRVIVLASGVPLLLTAIGPPGSAAGAAVAALVITPGMFAALCVASVAAALLLRLIRFPAGWMFGPMFASAALHGGDWIQGGLPHGAYAAALVGIGAIIGCRFGRISARAVLSHINAAIGSFIVSIAVSSAFVLSIAFYMHGQLGNIIVAFAPGAMDAMLALALTLRIDPIFVGVHHLSRFLVVTLLTPGVAHYLGRAPDVIDD
jgi:membrane AbrB-like protein